jgi:hypothetical protein
MSYVLPCAVCFAGPTLMIFMTWVCDWSARQTPVWTDVPVWGEEEEA